MARPEGCKCNWHSYMVGDGCEVCKPGRYDEGEPLPCCGSTSGVHLIGCSSDDALRGRIHRPESKGDSDG